MQWFKQATYVHTILVKYISYPSVIFNILILSYEFYDFQLGNELFCKYWKKHGFLTMRKKFQFEVALCIFEIRI